jgi:hypothetical protein
MEGIWQMICRGFTKPLSLTSDKLAELELHGVDAMRGMLASATDGYSGTSRTVVINLGAVAVTRGEIQDWLKWKAARDGCWIKVGTVAAVAAALFSFLALRR